MVKLKIKFTTMVQQLDLIVWFWLNVIKKCFFHLSRHEAVLNLAGKAAPAWVELNYSLSHSWAEWVGCCEWLLSLYFDSHLLLAAPSLPVSGSSCCYLLSETIQQPHLDYCGTMSHNGGKGHSHCYDAICCLANSTRCHLMSWDTVIGCPTPQIKFSEI